MLRSIVVGRPCHVVWRQSVRPVWSVGIRLVKRSVRLQWSYCRVRVVVSVFVYIGRLELESMDLLELLELLVVAW